MPTVLHCEDSEIQSAGMAHLFGKRIPDVRLVSALSLDQAIQLAQPILDDLRIVFTDGDLSEERNEFPVRFGWEVIEALKERGYKGLSVYNGITKLPDDKRHLFDEVMPKGRPSFREYLDLVVRYVQDHL